MDSNTYNLMSDSVFVSQFLVILIGNEHSEEMVDGDSDCGLSG